MFGNLIASCLLASAVASAVPKRAFNFNTLNGCYNILHVDSGEVYFNTQLFDHDVSIDFTSFGAPYQSCYVGVVNSTRDYFGSFENVDGFTMSYVSSDNYIEIQVDYYDDHISFRCNANDTFQDLSTGYVTDRLQYLCYASTVVNNLSSEQFNLFSIMFGREVNTYVSYYTGWYSMISNLGAYGEWYTRLVNDMTYNNVLFDSVNFVSHNANNGGLGITFSYVDNQNNTFDTIAVQDSQYQVNANRVYMSGALITDIMHSHLTQFGVFQFAPDSTEYGLDDLFFDIGDTPVVFITSLFDFELFGTNFAIAFMGILTIMIMVFLIKKVV